MPAILVLFTFLPNQISKGCGPTLDVNFSYTFIGDDLLGTVCKEAPFLLHVGHNRFDFKDKVYKFYGTEVEQQQKSNLEEWQASVCENAPINDIRKVVYHTESAALQTALSFIQGTTTVLDGKLKGNAFIDYLISLECHETIEYLLFAKECEPFVVARNAWSPPVHNSTKMSELINKGLKKFRRSKSHFIRLRYAYQMIRLAHYKGDYQGTLELFDRLLPKIDYEKNLIYYWILGHKAGALMGLGLNVEASYLYTIIFNNCPTRRESAYRSFLVHDDRDWQECYIKCKNDEERIAMYTIRACRADSRATKEMGHIYALNPQSPMLELLLVREIRKLEEDLLGQPGDGGTYSKKSRLYHLKPRAARGKYVIELQDFARRCRQERKVDNPNLWYIAEGYLEFLAGDYYKASQTFADAERKVKNEALRDQLNAFSRVLYVAEQEEIDTELEAEFYTITHDDEFYQKYPDFGDYFNDKIAELYEQANRPGLSFRSHYLLKELRYNPDLKIIEDLIQTIENEDERTRFERELAQGDLKNEAMKELANQKGTYWMSRGQLRRALDAFKQVDRADWDEFGTFTPFITHINDCVECFDDAELLVIDSTGALEPMNKGEILTAILEADSEARLGDSLSATKFYNIGIGLYNMSYYGPAWQAMDFYRSGNSLRSHISHRETNMVPLINSPNGNRENFDVSMAKNYFEEARYVALETDDFELAAKATFMAAKCDQKAFYKSSSWKPYGKNPIIPPPPYDENYRVLRDEYKNTDFYFLAVQECKYFRWYARE